MSAKIIDSHRYKTITKTQLDKKRKKNQDKIKAHKKKYRKSNRYSTNDNNGSFISNLRIKKLKERKLEREMLLYSRPQRTVLKEPKQKIYIPKSFVILCCVLVLTLLVYASAKIMKIDEKIAVNVFNDSDSQEDNVRLENDYELKIGLTQFDDKNTYTSKNLILNELAKQTSLNLVKVDNNYMINYKVARSIEKKSNREYVVTLNMDYKLNADDIKYSINKILESGSNNLYYDRLSIIDSINTDEKKDSLSFNLKQDDPYFIYDLDFPIVDSEGDVSADYTYNINENVGEFVRNPKSDNKTLKSIKLESYNSINESVDAFINKKIDMFFATSNNDMQLIGKNEYNVKKYKDGETLFLLGNKNSYLYTRKELRQAIMYSLNRDEIVKNSDNNFIEIIDLPFLYSSIKYKYDVVGAKNLMESNGWTQNVYGFYDKNENGNYLSATLRLLVNSQDESKVNVANNIKNMAQAAGINIQIEALSNEEISQRTQMGDYDLVLATVYLDETPNIDFLRQYLDINDRTSQAFRQVEESNVEDLEENIQNLEFVLSDEVACIGIYARNINLVYQKYINGFDDINYMKIFTDLNKIGKIIE